MSRWGRALVATGSALVAAGSAMAAAGTVHAAVNAVLLRRPDVAARPGPFASARSREGSSYVPSEPLM